MEDDMDIPFPDNVNFSTYVLSHAAQKWPQKTALVNGKTGHSLTFSQLKDVCERLAFGLAQEGFRAGDTICCMCPNVVEMAVMMFTIPAMRGVITPANPVYTAVELEKQIIHARATYMFVTPDMIEKAKAMKNAYKYVKKIFTTEPANGCISFDSLISRGKGPLSAAPINARKEVAVIHFSSGTTGLPKGAMLSHYSVLGHMVSLGPEGRGVFKPGDVIYALFPFFHLGGSAVSLYLPIYTGVTILCYASFDFEKFLQATETHKVSVYVLPPPVLLRLVKDPVVNKYDLTSVTTIFSGAAPISAYLEEEFYQKFKIRIGQAYGSTESGITHISPRQGHISGSAGKVVPNTKCKIVDIDTQKELGYNETGEVILKGPSVMMGYINKNTENNIDKDGWAHTGDVGYIDNEGRLFIVDRLKELIKYKGFQVAPAELEEVLLKHPAVADAAVIGVPDEIAGEVPRAYVVLKPQHKATATDIAQFVQDNVAPYKRLRGGVIFTDVIPKSQTGKILRRILRDQVKGKLNSKI